MAAVLSVLLVDGVGNAVTYDVTRDCLVILHAGHAFEKTRETLDGRAVYRLAGVKPPPVIRHVNKLVAKA